MPTLVSTGEITIADLNDAVQLLLSLPTVALPANAAGTVSSFATAVSTARVMQGGANVTASWTLSKADSNCTSTLASGVVTVSALSADAGSVTVTATRAGWPTLTAVFALSKAKQGATGATGSTGAAGATGSTGAAGAAGADAFTLLLSSEAWQLPADSGGNVTSYTGAVTTAKVLKGTTDDTSNWTFTRLASSANITSTASGTPAGSIVTITAMAAASAVEYVDITATKSGAPTLTKRFNVTKAKQGAAGAPGSTGATGSTGPRGTVELARAIATSVWSDSEAASALSGAGYGTAVSGDVVTLYNTSTKWAESRVYSGTWQTLAAHINGALLVDESVVAGKIDTRGLSIKDAAGNVILAAGTALGYLDAAGALRLAGDAVAYTDPRNLVDASSWVPGSAFPWSGLNTVAAENSVISGVGPNGATMALLKGLSNGDSATAGNWDGGYYNDGPLNTYRAIDTSKRYRVIVPFKRLDSSPSGTSRFYMGASPAFPGAGLERLYGQNGTSLISNPYFVNRLVSELPLNVWLYAVGYVYPLGSTNVALADTGIYVASTGEPVAGNNGAATFVWHSNAATLGSGLRAGQYDCKTVGEEMHFAPPFIHVVDGSEPKHTELFRPSSILNENISINADGTLSGGGAGQVTITGLGYTGDMNATSDLTLVADIGCTVAGNTITSTHTSSGFGNCAAHSREGFANGAYLSFVVNDLGKSFLAGLNDAPASSNTYTDMEFCWYLDASGNARVRTGANIAVDLYTTTVAVGDVLLIQYDGGACYFLKNGVLMYTATGVTPGRTYFADFSLYHVGTTVAGIKFGPLGNNAWGALAGIPYETIFNNDDSVALGFNPTFNWPSGNYPVNWLNWAGGVPTKETSIVRVGTAAVRYAASGANIGMQRQVSFAASPLPVGTFLAGSVDMYLVAFTSGKPLIVVDLFTDSALTAYTRREVPIPVASAGAVGAWQRVPWTARVGAAQQIYGVRIYVMGCWTAAVTGAFTGTVIFDNLRFMLADSTVDNKALTLSEASGVITIPGSGGGSVTAVTPNNKITPANVSTYLAAAAIDDVYIGNKITSSNFDGVIDAAGNITNVGASGWALGKAGQMVVDAAHVRGKLTVNQLSTLTRRADSANVFNNVFTLSSGVVQSTTVDPSASIVSAVSYAGGSTLSVKVRGHFDFAPNATYQNTNGRLNLFFRAILFNVTTGQTITIDRGNDYTGLIPMTMPASPFISQIPFLIDFFTSAFNVNVGWGAGDTISARCIFQASLIPMNSATNLNAFQSASASFTVQLMENLV